jgi:hypothetical protein
MRLVRASVGVWGTPAFWDTIGWWHTEVHYTIPRLDEERRMAARLELAFADTHTPSGVATSGNSHGSIPYTNSSATTFSASSNITSGNATIELKGQRLVINSSKLSAGQWQWESVGIRTEGVPTPLRRLLIRVLVGAEWVGDEGTKKTRTPLGPEYDRLSEFLSH